MKSYPNNNKHAWPSLSWNYIVFCYGWPLHVHSDTEWIRKYLDHCRTDVAGLVCQTIGAKK